MTTGKAIALAIQTFGDWNAKVGSEEIPGVIGKFGCGVQNKAGQNSMLVDKNINSLFIKYAQT